MNSRSIKPFKPNRKMRRILESVSKIDPIKQAILAEEAELKLWLAENQNIETSSLISIWKKETAATSEKLVNLVLRAHSFADGIVRANDTMRHGLKLEDGIDLVESTALISKMFKIELANMYISASACTKKQQAMLVNRIILSEFPLKDNMPAVPKAFTIPRGTQQKPVGMQANYEKPQTKPRGTSFNR